MKATQLAALAMIICTMAACRRAEHKNEMAADTMGAMPPAATTPAAPLPADTGMGAAQGLGSAVTMNAVGNSGTTGEAHFSEHSPTQTMVRATLSGQGTGAHGGAIHQGTCESPGTAVAPLQDITLANGTGTSSSTIDVPLATVMNGQHVVVFHQGQGTSGPAIACGAIPMMTPGAAGGAAGTGAMK
ncbi:MAG TPA: hypothetical protein VM759_00310 [Longimicrobium sp.]|nr:hypothetical protein [Longimicrobium sp.]